MYDVACDSRFRVTLVCDEKRRLGIGIFDCHLFSLIFFFEGNISHRSVEQRLTHRKTLIFFTFSHHHAVFFYPFLLHRKPFLPSSCVLFLLAQKPRFSRLFLFPRAKRGEGREGGAKKINPFLSFPLPFKVPSPLPTNPSQSSSLVRTSLAQLLGTMRGNINVHFPTHRRIIPIFHQGALFLLLETTTYFCPREKNEAKGGRTAPRVFSATTALSRLEPRDPFIHSLPHLSPAAPTFNSRDLLEDEKVSVSFMRPRGEILPRLLSFFSFAPARAAMTARNPCRRRVQHGPQFFIHPLLQSIFIFSSHLY